MKIRDEVLDFFKQFCADVGNTCTFVFLMKVTNTFQMSLSAIVGNKELPLKNPLHILFSEIDNLEEFEEHLLLWPALSWIKLAWTKNIGNIL